MIADNTSFASQLRRRALAFAAICLLSNAAMAQTTDPRPVPDLDLNVDTLADARDFVEGLTAAEGKRPINVIKVWEVDTGATRAGNYEGRLITGQYPDPGVMLTEGVAMHVTVQGPISENGEEGAPHECPPCPSCTGWIIAFVLALITALILLIRVLRS